MRLLVCGGRDYDAANIVRDLMTKMNPSLVMSGPKSTELVR